VTEPRDPTTDEDEDSGLSGILGRAGAAALRPVRAAAHAGKDVLNDEAERAMDGVMAGPLPEAVGRSLIEHRVIERVVSSALETKSAETGTSGPSVDMEQMEQAVRTALANPALERMLKETISSRLTTELADQIVQSPAFKNTLSSVLSSPEVRHALTRQSTGFAADIAAALRRKARGADGGLESAVRKVFGRPRPDPQRAGYGGLVTRGLAFVMDLLIIHVIYLVGGGMIGLITSIFGTLKPTWLVGTLAGVAGILLVGIYFVLFWSTAGQTPGGRIMRLRVEHDGDAPAVWRSIVRLVGVVLSIIPMFAGYIPVLFDSRRRGLPDYMAGTVIECEPLPEPVPAADPALAA
jgi:uncharacterized RDD family membrane protein YckC